MTHEDQAAPFERMLDAIKRGEVGAIICWQPDRLYRSMKDLERLVDATDRGIEIRSVNGGDFDLSKSTGRMLARILGSVARQESELKGERRCRANLQRASSGVWRADQPRLFGWTKTGEHLEPEATAVREAVHEVLAGRSLRAIAADLNGRGILTARGKQWTNLTLRRVLTNPAHAGLRTYRGKIVGRGAWAPIVDEDTWLGLVAYLSDSSRTSASAFERRHVGSGIYRCGVCGGKLYAAYGRPGAMMYRCKQLHVARAGAPLDEYVTAIVLALLRRADIGSRLAPREQFDVAAMHAQRAGLQARADELARLFAKGSIGSSQLESGTTDLRGQIAGIDAALADAAATSPAVQLLDGDPDELETRWAAASADIKGKIVAELMTVTVLKAPRGPKGFNPDFVRVEPKT